MRVGVEAVGEGGAGSGAQGVGGQEGGAGQGRAQQAAPAGRGDGVAGAGGGRVAGGRGGVGHGHLAPVGTAPLMRPSSTRTSQRETVRAALRARAASGPVAVVVTARAGRARQTCPVVALRSSMAPSLVRLALLMAPSRQAETPPIYIKDDDNADDNLRLKYRYLR